MKIRDLKWIKDYWWESKTSLGKFIIYETSIEKLYYWEFKRIKRTNGEYIGDYSIRSFDFNLKMFNEQEKAMEDANKYWKKIAQEVLDDIFS